VVAATALMATIKIPIGLIPKKYANLNHKIQNIMKLIYTMATAALLSMAACSPFKVVADYDQMVNFQQYKTYQIHQESFAKLNLNDFDKSRVLNAFHQEMKAKGFQESATPDMLVQLDANNKTIRDVNTTNVSPWGYGGFGRFGGFGFGMGSSRTWTEEYLQGSLVFNFVDAKSQKLIWQGVGSGISVENPQAKVHEIPALIKDVLAQYPPGSHK
jgi:Domain of unknown function (DUF4136)